MRGTTFKAFSGTTMADAVTGTRRRGRKDVGRKYPQLVRLFEAPAPENAPSYNPPAP